MERQFQVDLRGIVDLLSHHLYASPRVYVRELLQNAADAITARGGEDGAIRVQTRPDGSLSVHDNGIGLTEDEVHSFLASVGRTSKRDELGFARRDFLGQFGIGLLSCFMVADAIEVETRSVRGGDPIRWLGRSDGRYSVEPGTRAAPGTTVTLRPREGAQHWLRPAEVAELIRSYGHLLDVDVTLDGVPMTDPAAPWEVAGADRESLLAYGESVLGGRPMDVIRLDVPEAELRGLAFVLPSASVVGHGGHRVYLKRMLLTEDASKLLPEWAFFVRCVIDTAHLRPTASREALYEDDLLAQVRAALGEQIRTWLLQLSATDPDRLAHFLRVHHLGVKALAVRDDEMLRLVDAWLPMETTRGTMPLRVFRGDAQIVRYTDTVDEFRALSAIASAAGTPVVNAGYAYDAEILQRLPRLVPGIEARRLDPGELAARFERLAPGQEATLAGFLAAAESALFDVDCVPLLRQFEPVAVPALYVRSRQASTQDAVRRGIESADELWSDVLSALADVEVDHRPQLILNWRHPLVRRIASAHRPDLVANAVGALYGQALLAGHYPLRAVDSAALNRSFLALLDQAFGEKD